MDEMSANAPALPLGSNYPILYPKEAQRQREKLTVEQWKKEFFETLSQLSETPKQRIDE